MKAKKGRPSKKTVAARRRRADARYREALALTVKLEEEMRDAARDLVHRESSIGIGNAVIENHELYKAATKYVRAHDYVVTLPSPTHEGVT